MKTADGADGDENGDPERDSTHPQIPAIRSARASESASVGRGPKATCSAYGPRQTREGCCVGVLLALMVALSPTTTNSRFTRGLRACHLESPWVSSGPKDSALGVPEVTGGDSG